MRPSSRGTVRDGRKKDEVGAVGMEETVLIPPDFCAVRVISRLQRDHVNEPDFDEKSAEGEDADEFGAEGMEEAGAN